MTIQLLCPTCDEKLNCPNEFAGKLGKCPHCGSKFKVPVPKGGAPVDDDALEIGDSDILAEDERIVDSDILDRDDDAVTGQLLDSDVLDRSEASDDMEQIRIGPPPEDEPELIVADDHEKPRTPPPAPPQSQTMTYQVQGHPMAGLFHYLWEQRKQGAQIELHLKDGEKIAPESYAPGLSQVSHGVFAIKSLDGNHTMAAIAWDSVTRVTVRGVKSLPAETFV